MAFGIEVALYLAAAAIVAAAIRLYDSPKTSVIVDGKIQWAYIVPVVVGAALAVPIGCWILGIDILDPKGFATAVGLGVAGLSFVKAILNVTGATE